MSHARQLFVAVAKDAMSLLYMRNFGTVHISMFCIFANSTSLDWTAL